MGKLIPNKTTPKYIGDTVIEPTEAYRFCDSGSITCPDCGSPVVHGECKHCNYYPTDNEAAMDDRLNGRDVRVNRSKGSKKK